MRVNIQITRNILTGSVADILRDFANKFELGCIAADLSPVPIQNQYGEQIGIISTSGKNELLGADNGEKNGRLIHAAPYMEKALAHILVLVQQGVDDYDIEAIESHCRDALGRAWGVHSEDVSTPDLAQFK